MKKSYIAFLFVIFTIFSFEIIYFARVIKSQNKTGSLNTIQQNVDNRIRNNYNNDSATKSVSNSEIKISPSAKIEMIQYYEKCGHVTSQEHKVPNAIVNMTEDEIKKYYSGWKIQFFSKDYIKIYKKNNSICPEHFVLKDVDGYISIFNIGINEKEVLYKATDIVTKYLSEDDKSSLKDGVNVTGKDELEALLQDFE